MTLPLEAPNERGTQWVKYAKAALRVGFNRAIKLEFHGAKVSSDAGLSPYRDVNEAAQLTDSGAAELFDFRTATNAQHGVTALLRQWVYSRLAGYEDVKDGECFRMDSTCAELLVAGQKRGKPPPRARSAGRQAGESVRDGDSDEPKRS